MRIVIVPGDRTIGIDGDFLNDVEQDFSWISSDVHAIQWYGSYGEIEYNDGRLNERIDYFDFDKCIEIFNLEKERLKRKEELKKEQEEIEEQRKALEWEQSRDYAEEFIALRNGLLSESDWTQIPDAPLTEEEREMWRIYRQKLRDLPPLIEDPKPLAKSLRCPEWPTPPIPNWPRVPEM